MGSQGLPQRGAWVAQPEMSDDAIREGTGHGWDHWVALIEGEGPAAEGHTAVAAWLVADGVDPWWAQGVTVGWERITGRRLPHQMADGTFTANRSRTVQVAADELRAALLSEDGRARLFPDHDVALRSKPTSKALRFGIGGGIALIELVARPDGRAKVTVAHEKLPSFDDVTLWKAFWSDWLDAVTSDV